METSSDVEAATNAAILQRNMTGGGTEVWYDPRPTSTKYTSMTMVEPRRHVNPPNRYAQHVQQESVLQNRLFALQRCDQPVYVPSSKSAMYVQQSKEKAVKAAPMPGHHQLFNNDTRSQRNA
jgi:hypothetical protein